VIGFGLWYIKVVYDVKQTVRSWSEVKILYI